MPVYISEGHTKVIHELIAEMKSRNSERKPVASVTEHILYVPWIYDSYDRFRDQNKTGLTSFQMLPASGWGLQASRDHHRLGLL